MRKTPEKIESLKPNEIFVFGSNPSGFHVGGAAKVALKKFGAIYGQSEGLQGQSYAIPSILPDVESIRSHVEKFICYAKKNPHLKFLVTQIGCGHAGYTPYDIAPLFFGAYDLENVYLPESFIYVIEHQSRFVGVPLNSWDSNKDFLSLKNSFQKSLMPNYKEISKIYTRTFLNTIQIVNSGFYITEEGLMVKLPDSRRMTERTRFYEKEFSVDNVPSLSQATLIEVTEKDCLKETVRLLNEGYYPAVLNMASRKNPGGGVLHGSRAQEESIFRRTNIFRSLYQFIPYAGYFGVVKSDQEYPLDQNFGGIYSPDVVLFRDSERYGCKLLKNPIHISVISVAAMNRPKIDATGKICGELVEGVKNKIRTIFRIALGNRHDSLILGAWGCGAYCNPPKHIASLFHEILNEKEFRNKFRKIVFAIIEDNNSHKAHNPDGNLLPFRTEFK